MSCERFAEAITDHACGAPLEDAAGLHLAGCAACRRALEEQRRMFETAEDDLRRALDVSVSPGFVAETVRRAHASSSRAPAPSLWWMGAAAAAVLAFGAWMGVRAMMPAGPRGDTPPNTSTALELPAPGSVPGPQIPETVATARPSRDEPTSRERFATAAGAAAARSREPASSRASAPANRRTVELASSRTREPASPRPPEPEVLVPPAQARAIARLRELVDVGVLDGAGLPPPAPLGSEAAPLTVVPLHVPEIVVPTVEAKDSGVAGESGPQEVLPPQNFSS